MEPRHLQSRQNKQRIRKIKTEHDDTAHIDQSVLFQQTKNLHQLNIQYAQYADSITDTLFPLKPLEIGFVQSIALKDDPKFKQIRHLLQKYNEQVLQYNQKSVIGLHLKTIVMDSMLKFIRLMLQAPEKSAKRRILQISYYWFKKNLDSSNKKKSKKVLQTQVRNILLENKLLPKSIIDRELPSSKMAEELHHFKIKARTDYPQIDPPSVDLENYITHKLGFGNQKGMNLYLKNKQQSRQQKWKNRVIFKKPYIQQNYSEVHPQEMPDHEAIQKMKQQQENLALLNNQNQKPIQGQLQGNQVNEITDQQEDFGVPAEQGDEPHEDEQEEIPEVKRGKLDPLVKIFLLDRSKRAKTQGQQSAENKYRYKRNFQLQQLRQNNIEANHIQQWANQRSRYKSELSRKIQSIRSFNHVSTAKKQISLSTCNPIRVEHTLNKARLNQTLKQYKNYLNHEPASVVTENLQVQKSMSVYCRNRLKTEGPKTFSSILQDRKRYDQKSNYLDEIQDLKKKFAKYKLYTPLDNFKKAITHPEEKQCNWSELDKATSDKIELPRCNMISNPFIKAAKKKKKKGAKKR